MEQTPEVIIQRIVVAFERRELPESGLVFQSHSFEVDTQIIERLARQTTWIDFPRDVLCENPLALAFMTPEAFAWFLPAYLVMSVARYAETRTLTSSLLTCLTPPDEADAREFKALVDEMHALDPDILLEEDATDALGADEELLQFVMERAAVLTQDEKVAVRDYLEYIEAAHGADFPDFGPKLALDRYWAAAARTADGES